MTFPLRFSSLILLLLCSVTLSAQKLRIEPAAGFGKGGVMNQGSISEYLGELEASDSVTRTAFSQEKGTAYRVGAYVDLSFESGLSIRSGLHYRSLSWSSDLELDKEEGGSGGGTSTESSTKVRSEASFQAAEMIVPAMVRYEKEMDKLLFFGSAGLDLAFRMGRVMHSDETVTTTTENNVSGHKTTDKQHFEETVELDGLSGLNPSLSGEFGAGYRVGPGRITLAFRLSSGFGGRLFTTNDDLRRNGALNGEVYTKDGQERIQDEFGISMDDFRSTTWSIGLGYRLAL